MLCRKPAGKHLDLIEEYCTNYTERKCQMYDYLRNGIASSSFERRVRLKIPKNDIRESSLASPFHAKPPRFRREESEFSDSGESSIRLDENGPGLAKSYKRESENSFIRGESLSSNIYRASPSQFTPERQAATFESNTLKPPKRRGLSQLRNLT